MYVIYTRFNCPVINDYFSCDQKLIFNPEWLYTPALLEVASIQIYSDLKTITELIACSWKAYLFRKLSLQMILKNYLKITYHWNKFSATTQRLHIVTLKIIRRTASDYVMSLCKCIHLGGGGQLKLRRA